MESFGGPQRLPSASLFVALVTDSGNFEISFSLKQRLPGIAIGYMDCYAVDRRSLFASEVVWDFWKSLIVTI